MLKTYGTILLEPGRNPRWHVKDLAPHVAVAFKRLFPRVDQYATEFFISDSEDTRADLFWFLQRYPFDTKHMAMLRAGDKAVKDRVARRGEILSPDWKPNPGKGIREGCAPYLYQAQAAKIAVDQGGLLLADDVGLGKTEGALTAIAMGAPLPAGVVVQTHLAYQWAERIEKFTTWTSHVIYSTTPYSLPPADIYIFRYSNIHGWIDFLKNGLLKTIIYDEIQELRTGIETAKGRCCSIVSARAKFRMGLTATATYNYGDEIHTVMEFLKPDLLGEREEFLREWCSSGRIVKEPDALGEFLKETGWMLRRDEDDPNVNQSMPKPNIIPIEVDWNNSDVDDEAALIRSLAMRVMGGNFQGAGSAARELDVRMRQMTGIAKARSVAAYVKMLLQDNEKVILTGWHREVYAIWLKALEQFKPVLYTGSEDAGKKQRAINQFTVGSSRVFILSNRSGAGIDGLQHYCWETVIGEFDWSPQVHKQIIGRTRRPGQKHQVNAHFPFVNHGSDPVLMEVNAIKSDQARGIHDPGVVQAARVTDESRIKRLAKYVLEQEAPADSGCAICGKPSTGKALNIVPLADADDYPAGPEREALFGPENIWFLCAEHESEGV
jgi:superfamily II DNA or RNA helicase